MFLFLITDRGLGRPNKIPSCKGSEVLSPTLTTILLCKAPSSDPEWCAWDELFIKEGQADGPDGVCREQRERLYIRADFLFCFLYFVLLQVGGFAGLSVTRLANS